MIMTGENCGRYKYRFGRFIIIFYLFSRLCHFFVSRGANRKFLRSMAYWMHISFFAEKSSSASHERKTET